MRIISLIILLGLVVSGNTTDILTVKQNETVSLKCPVDLLLNNNHQQRNEFLIVQWFKDSQRLNKLTLPHRYTLNGHDLHIQQVASINAGQYTCKVINGYGNVEHTFQLIVNGTMNTGISLMDRLSSLNSLKIEKFSPPVFMNPDLMIIRDYSRSVNGFVKFNCEAIGTPRPDILWFKNGEVLSEEDYGITRSQWYLSLKDIRSSDEGNYTCQVFNKIGYINATYTLTVTEASVYDNVMNNEPEFMNTTVIADMDAILECRIKYSSSDIPSVKWMKQISRVEYDNYVLQNNIEATQMLMNTPMNTDNQQNQIQNLYQLNKYWDNKGLQNNQAVPTEQSSFYSLSDLIGSNNLNNQLDNLQANDLLNLRKRSVSDESVHYITLTSSPLVAQKLRFNRNQGLYISQLKIKQTTRKDSGIYVCFLDGKSHGKAYLHVLPNHYEGQNIANKFLTNVAEKSNFKTNQNNDFKSSIALLVVLIPVVLITAFALASILYLKNHNQQRNRATKQNASIKGLFKFASNTKSSKSLQLQSTIRKDSATSTMITSTPSTDIYKQNKSCSEAGKTTNTSFSDTSSTTATSVPYYATCPLLENSPPPPPLPNTQPPAYVDRGLDRSDSTPSMAYYKIVENEVFHPEHMPVQDSEATNSSRVYYQLAPNHITNYQQQPNQFYNQSAQNYHNSNNFYV